MTAPVEAAPMKLVIASSNAGKLAEFGELLAGTGIDLVTQGALGVDDADETGLTFVENALLKARHAVARHRPAGTGRRFGPVRRRARRRAGTVFGALRRRARRRRRQHRQAVDALADVPAAQRSAHFYAVIVLLRHADDPQPLIAEGVWPGADPGCAPRPGRFRLRPGVPRSGARAVGGGVRACAEEPHQPPRPRPGGAARQAAGGDGRNPAMFVVIWEYEVRAGRGSRVRGAVRRRRRLGRPVPRPRRLPRHAIVARRAAAPLPDHRPLGLGSRLRRLSRRGAGPLRADQCTGRHTDPRRTPPRPLRDAMLTTPPLSLYVHLPVVRAQMPVLRLQLARGPRRAAVRCLRRRAAGRPGPGPAAGLGPHGAHGVLRRRHAQPVPARVHRSLPAGRERAAAVRARGRDHAGDQSRHRRARPLRGLPRRRREPPELRHPELRRRLPAAPRPHPRQRRGRGGGEAGAGRRLRQPQPRPDVRAAAADAGDGRARPRARVRAAAHPRLALPADAGAQHRVRGAGRRPASPTTTAAGTCRSIARRCSPTPATRSTRSAPTRGPAASARTTSTTGVTATTSASAPAPTASSRSAASRPCCGAGSTSTRPPTWPTPAPRPAIGGDERIEPARRPFEFMLNALRLVDGFSLAEFEARTGLAAAAIAPQLQVAVAQGWLDVSTRAACARPTSAGALPTTWSLCS